MVPHARVCAFCIVCLFSCVNNVLQYIHISSCSEAHFVYVCVIFPKFSHMDNIEAHYTKLCVIILVNVYALKYIFFITLAQFSRLLGRGLNYLCFSPDILSIVVTNIFSDTGT